KNQTGGRTFLNLFAYSGTFSISAALGGMSTTSVDLANRTKELVTDNFNNNNLPLDAHKIYIMETFEFLKYAARNNHSYDTILSIRRVSRDTGREYSRWTAIIQSSSLKHSKYLTGGAH